MLEILQILAKVTAEPNTGLRQSHSSAHLLNTPMYERKYAKAYLGDENTQDAVQLRIQIARGSKSALEDQ